MLITTLRRPGTVAAAAAVLALGLGACGSSDNSDSAGDGGSSDLSSSMAASPMPSSPMASDSMGGSSMDGSGMSDAGSQTFGPACSAIPKSGAGSFDGMVKDPVATAASNNPLLSTLVTAVGKAGLADTLNGADGLSVFAPTNDAFAKLPKATLKKVLANKALLTKILTHHVVAGKLNPTKIVGKHMTLNKDTVTVSGDTNGMTVGEAKVLCGNIPTANATVYVIDSVLMPTGM